MLRLARRTAPLVAAALLALVAWSWWPAAWPPATRWLAPLVMLVAVLLLRRVQWEPGASGGRRGTRSRLALDEAVRRSAEAWDARHAPPDEADAASWRGDDDGKDGDAGSPGDEAWRGSLGAPWQPDGDEDDEAWGGPRER